MAIGVKVMKRPERQVSYVRAALKARLSAVLAAEPGPG